MKKIFFLLLFVFAVCPLCGEARAQEADLPLIAEGEFFSVYAYPGMDTQELLQKLNFDYFFQVDGLKTGSDSPKDIIAKTFDAIYLEVSDTLGISAYAFKGKVKIFANQEALSSEYAVLFGKGFPERAFYLHETGTLYLSLEDLTIGMLAHEMAHVIMSHYFVIPPPPRLQEILSGYAEYHFQKMMAPAKITDSERPLAVNDMP